ncbi:WbuC family cupin fold metalloprotein [Chitinimonas sp.]|uniref:WbuC family cupin fold metalloprotein n=1 Tax=Chitinimonas sp. TaxID=1934313 RepID=UPI0035AE6A55
MKTLKPADLDDLTSRAASAPRLRAHHNFHPSHDAPVQRLTIAMEPDTYVRPHRHPQSWELLIPLRGSFLFTAYDEAGSVLWRHKLGGSDGLAAFEFEAGTWHTVASLEAGSVIFEVKQGAYVPVGPTDAASWAPEEGSAAAAAFVADLHRAAGQLSVAA